MKGLNFGTLSLRDLLTSLAKLLGFSWQSINLSESLNFCHTERSEVSKFKATALKVPKRNADSKNKVTNSLNAVAFERNLICLRKSFLSGQSVSLHFPLCFCKKLNIKKVKFKQITWILAFYRLNSAKTKKEFHISENLKN